MRHSQKRTLAFAALSLVLAALWLSAPAGAQRGRPGGGVDVYAITNARIVTVSGPVIERGTVVIRDGLIASVGANVNAPPDARAIDGTGLTVYPGLIDASTTLAIPRPSPSPGAGGPGGGLAGLFGQTAPSAVSLVLAALWLSAPAGAQRGRPGGGVDVYAITNARIVTVSGAVIERGTVVIRDGLIASVGANVAAPPDARAIDGTG
ncbi:MAG TPA: hypothetical protein VFZ44_21070, partial [Pyrinomonadaceae bacterium]